MKKEVINNIFIGVFSSIIATLLLSLFYGENVDRTFLIIKMLSGILILAFIIILFNPVINLLHNYKYLKGVKIYWWDLNKDNKFNNLEEFDKHLSPKFEKAHKRIICKLNTGKLFYELFESNLINNPQIKHLNNFIIIFSTPKVKVHSAGQENVYKETIFSIQRKKQLISKGRLIDFKIIEESRSLYNYVVIDDYCFFSIGGVTLDINLKKCDDQVSKIIERLNEHIIITSEKVKVDEENS